MLMSLMSSRKTCKSNARMCRDTPACVCVAHGSHTYALMLWSLMPGYTMVNKRVGSGQPSDWEAAAIANSNECLVPECHLPGLKLKPHGKEQRSKDGRQVQSGPENGARSPKTESRIEEHRAANTPASGAGEITAGHGARPCRDASRSLGR